MISTSRSFERAWDPIAEIRSIPNTIAAISPNDCESIISMTTEYMLWPLAMTTLGYLAHIEYSPGMGNVWWREGRFCPKGAWKVMIFPFSEPAMWYPEFWDLNYPVWMAVTVVAVYAYSAICISLY